VRREFAANQLNCQKESFILFFIYSTLFIGIIFSSVSSSALYTKSGIVKLFSLANLTVGAVDGGHAVCPSR
jgi:hypothetical protein